MRFSTLPMAYFMEKTGAEVAPNCTPPRKEKCPMLHTIIRSESCHFHPVVGCVTWCISTGQQKNTRKIVTLHLWVKVR